MHRAPRYGIVVVEERHCQWAIKVGERHLIVINSRASSVCDDG